ncbi:MAG: hypothetical protein ACT4P6_05020 [Gemmatimonadaceae bacterium]
MSQTLSMRLLYLIAAGVVLIALAEVCGPARQRSRSIALIGVNVLPMD